MLILAGRSCQEHLAPAAVHVVAGKILQGVMSSLGERESLLSRAWSGNSLAVGVQHCLTRAGIAEASTGSNMAETSRVSKAALLRQVKDCINLARWFF